MPFVTVQLGQCGNQLGTEFFKSLVDDAFEAPNSYTKEATECYQDLLLEK